MTEEQPLEGGVANAGRVVRVGDCVLRPANAYSDDIHRFLRALRDAGFESASQPVGIDPDGRERLVFIEGAVPVPPYPVWAQHDTALASIARLLRRFHEAARAVDAGAARWSDEMADPAGGVIVCHNDVCLENVVFADGIAVGLLDFDFAAPGRPTYDLTQMARMCVPIDDDVNAARLGWEPADRSARLRLVADAYGLDGAGRAELLEIMAASIARGGELSAVGSPPVIPTSSRCGMRWVGPSVSTAAAVGGKNNRNRCLPHFVRRDMELSNAVDFARVNTHSVLVTIRGNGRPQLSNILHHVFDDGIIRISITADRAKYKNLVREPWAALHITQPDFWAYAVLEGDVELTPISTRTDDATVDELVEYYKAAVGEHENWDEYRESMVADRRVIVRFRPNRAYGMI